MSLRSRLTRLLKLEKARLPRGRRITEVVTTFVDPNPIPNGPPVPLAVHRRNIEHGTDELWIMPDVPDPLPEGVDATAVARFKSFPPDADFLPARGGVGAGP